MFSESGSSLFGAPAVTQTQAGTQQTTNAAPTTVSSEDETAPSKTPPPTAASTLHSLLLSSSHSSDDNVWKTGIHFLDELLERRNNLNNINNSNDGLATSTAAIELNGRPNSGKTITLKRIAAQSLVGDPSTPVIYYDLDCKFNADTMYRILRSVVVKRLRVLVKRRGGEDFPEEEEVIDGVVEMVGRNLYIVRCGSFVELLHSLELTKHEISASVPPHVIPSALILLDSLTAFHYTTLHLDSLPSSVGKGTNSGTNDAFLKLKQILELGMGEVRVVASSVVLGKMRMNENEVWKSMIKPIKAEFSKGGEGLGEGPEAGGGERFVVKAGGGYESSFLISDVGVSRDDEPEIKVEEEGDNDSEMTVVNV